MTFDDDLIQAVQDQAPPGVHFEGEEVKHALAKAINRVGWSYPGSGSLVEVAAWRALRARLPKPEPRPAGFWERIATRLGWS